MSILDPNDFKIEERHLEHGLTTADLRAIIGDKVIGNPLDFYAHGTPLLNGVSLTKRQRSERCEQIYNSLYCMFGPSEARRQAEKATEITNAVILSVLTPAQKLLPLQKALSDPAPKQIGGLFVFSLNEERQVVIPAADQVWHGNENIGLSVMSRILFLPHDLPSKQFWCLTCRLPAHVIKNFPESKIANLIAQGHEAAHGQQLTLDNNPEYAFNCELHSDSFGLGLAKNMENANEPRKAWIHARNLNILLLPDQYWIGLHLDARETGGATPNYRDVIKAGYKIRRALCMDSLGTAGIAPSLVDLYYDWWKKKAIHQHPEKALRNLQQMQASGRFETDRTTALMANKILGAVRYFSPSLLAPR